jgi:uncharacterized protein YcfJ
MNKKNTLAIALIITSFFAQPAHAIQEVAVVEYEIIDMEPAIVEVVEIEEVPMRTINRCKHKKRCKKVVVEKKRSPFFTSLKKGFGAVCGILLGFKVIGWLFC